MTDTQNSRIPYQVYLQTVPANAQAAKTDVLLVLLNIVAILQAIMPIAQEILRGNENGFDTQAIMYLGVYIIMVIAIIISLILYIHFRNKAFKITATGAWILAHLLAESTFLVFSIINYFIYNNDKRSVDSYLINIIVNGTVLALYAILFSLLYAFLKKPRKGLKIACIILLLIYLAIGVWAIVTNSNDFTMISGMLGATNDILTCLLSLLTIIIVIKVKVPKKTDTPIAVTAAVSQTKAAASTRLPTPQASVQSVADYCLACGNPLNPGSQFCGKCGKPTQ